MPGRVCIVGSINMDLVVRTPAFPAPGETLAGGPFQTFPGGKGANQAVAAARMGAGVSIVGRVGADVYGNELRAVLAREGVNLAALRTTAGESTGVGLITVDESTGENTIVTVGGANQHLVADDIRSISGFIRSADVLLMQLEVSLDAVAAAADIAHLSNRMVVLNAAPACGLPDSFLNAIDVLIANENEAVQLAGAPEKTHADDLAQALLARGPRAVLITLGAKGAVVADAAGFEVIPSVTVDAIDTVGAGDAFCGSVAAMLSEGKSLHDAVRIGCVAGALASTRHGAIPSLPTREAVGRLLTKSELPLPNPALKSS